MVEFDEFSNRLQALRERIAAACEACGRGEHEVAILPVTKNHPVEAVALAQRAGLAAVGENRVQEAQSKIQEWKGESMRWELIGHLQSNKAKLAAGLFDRVQSVDSEKLLQRLDAGAMEANKVLAILLQINAGDDPAKFGVECDDAETLLATALKCPHLRVEGLMTVAPMDDEEAAERAFERLRQTRDRLSQTCGVPLRELSMGMTDDLEAAIHQGSTQVRVGTALYGQRVYD